MKVFPTILFCLLFSACSPKATLSSVTLPAIPAHVLKDPSGLAYDGENFYVADWAGLGLLRLNPSGRIERLVLPGSGKSDPERIIQASAVKRNALVVETADAELYLWDTGSSLKAQRLSYEFDRTPGSPMCWDGIYLWIAGRGRAFPTIILAGRELVVMPRRERPLSDIVADGSNLGISMACGWGRSYAMSHSGEERLIFSEFLGAGEMTVFPWTDLQRDPIALAALGPKRAAVLARRRERDGFFELVMWQNGRIVS